MCTKTQTPSAADVNQHNAVTHGLCRSQRWVRQKNCRGRRTFAAISPPPPSSLDVLFATKPRRTYSPSHWPGEGGKRVQSGISPLRRERLSCFVFLRGVEVWFEWATRAKSKIHASTVPGKKKKGKLFKNIVDASIRVLSINLWKTKYLIPHLGHVVSLMISDCYSMYRFATITRKQCKSNLAWKNVKFHLAAIWVPPPGSDERTLVEHNSPDLPREDEWTILLENVYVCGLSSKSNMFLLRSSLCSWTKIKKKSLTDPERDRLTKWNN